MCWEINLVSLEALQHHRCFFYFINMEGGTHKENLLMSNWVFLSCFGMFDSILLQIHFLFYYSAWVILRWLTLLFTLYLKSICSGFTDINKPCRIGEGKGKK